MAPHVMRRGASGLVALLAALVLSLSQALPAQAALAIPLGPGSGGPAVELWQKDLNWFMRALETCRPSLDVDGQFGPKTTNATKCYQRIYGLSDDGIVGKQTRAAMCDDLWYMERGSLYKATCT